MKKLFALMLMFLLAIGLFAGCLTDSGGGDDDEGDNEGVGGGTASAVDYFPILSGGSWTFDETSVYPDGSTHSYSYTMQTNGTQTVNGVAYTILSDSEGYKQFFRIANNVVYLYDEYMEIAKESPAKAAMIAQIASEEYPWLDFTKGVGGTWTMFESVDQYEGTTITWKQTGKYVGTESVTVPSGSYSNCMKFQMTDTWNSSGNGHSWSEVRTQTYWLAKNVGPVKILEVSEDETEVFETTTTVLASYDKNGGGDGSGDDGGDGGDGTPGTHAFLPIKDEASWMYQETEKDFSDNSTFNTTYTSIINGTSVIDGKSYWVMESSDEEVDDYLRIENGIVYSFLPEGTFAQKLAPETQAAMKQAMVEVDDPADELPVFKLDVSAGTSWDIFNYSNDQSGSNVTVTWTGKYIGTENVNVSAGSFSNCRKYEMTLSSIVTYAGINYSYSTKSYFWLAQNVGFVRIYDLEMENGENKYEYDQKLSYYYIP